MSKQLTYRRGGLVLTAAALFLSWQGAPVTARAAALKARPGTVLNNRTLRDIKGLPIHLRAEATPTVYLMLSTQCPISNVYTPRFLALEKSYRVRGVRFVAVYANTNESAAEIKKHVAERHLPFVVVKDDGTLAAELGATMTPQAILVDGGGTLRYRGRIDDNRDPAQVKSRDLKLALDAVLTGKTVARTETAAFGCALRPALPGASVKLAKVTYARDVAPILNARCVECHRDGEVAPFSLETYTQAAAWAKPIQTYTANRQMPPWKAESHGEFHSERRLSDTEISTIAAWVEAGAPQGDPKLTPKPPKFAANWKLNTPDVVYTMPETFTTPSDGRDLYQCFVVPTDYSEDRWVSAIEVRPGNRKVVHHVIAYLDTSGTARKLDAAESGPGYRNPTPGNAPGFMPAGILGGWAPGNEPRLLPAGIGTKLPKGADLVLEVHYHMNGKPENDKTEIGLHFAKGRIEKQMRLGFVGTFKLDIPPGEANHVVKTSTRLTNDVTLYGITPHMHSIGHAMTVKATTPDGKVRPLVHVPDWDFNWQITYSYKEPVKLPAGTVIDLTARYDNSDKNPKNPNKPPKRVTWGEQTTDEMCIALMGWTVDTEKLSAANPEIAYQATPAALANYAGRYLTDTGLSVTFRNEGEKLFAKVGDQSEMELKSVARHTFTYPGVDTRLVFVPGKAGKAQEIRIQLGGRDLVARRADE